MGKASAFQIFLVFYFIFQQQSLICLFSPSSLTCKRPIPRTMRVVLGQCLYTGKNGRFQCPCKAGTASLSFDTCCGPFCDTCTRPMGDHDEYTEHHPYCKAGLRQPHLQCLEDVGIFFSNTPRLFGYILVIRSRGGMPRSKHLQDPKIAAIFKLAVASDGIGVSKPKNSLLTTLELIWRNGWLHFREVQGRTFYVFPNSIRRW